MQPTDTPTPNTNLVEHLTTLQRNQLILTVVGTKLLMLQTQHERNSQNQFLHKKQYANQWASYKNNKKQNKQLKFNNFKYNNNYTRKYNHESKKFHTRGYY